MNQWRIEKARPSCRSLRVAALMASVVLIAAPAMSQTLAYTITGIIDGNDYDTVFSESGAEYFPLGGAPWAGGVPYLLTFSLDPSAAQAVGATNLSTYPEAVFDVDLAIGLVAAVDWAVAEVASVEETIVPILTQHDWTATALANDPGSNDAMPEFDVTNEEEGTVTVGYQSLQTVFIDRTGTLFSSNPPELVAPDLSSAPIGFIELRFVGGGVITGIAGSIDSVTVTVPEPSFALAIAIGAFGVGASRSARRRRGRV